MERCSIHYGTALQNVKMGPVAARTPRSARRADALSRERIIEAAVELLDVAGEAGLTLRTLAERLATGSGAIYWHVANKGGLLDAATDAVLAAALATDLGEANEAGATPQDKICAVALGLFDAIDHHPWLATQLATQMSRSPWKSATPRILEAIGRQIRALGVPEASWLTATFALVHYILGAAGQNAVNGRSADPTVDRSAFLDAVSTEWEQLDPDDYAFTRAVAKQVRDHDDRAEFLAGIELILAGITRVHPLARRGRAAR